jgi:hypothetical protein
VFCCPRKNLIPNLKLHWLSPEILKAEKLISTRTLIHGMGTKLGYGLRYKKWIGLGIHSGLNWDWSNKLVVPILPILD